jgi:hypothetical protein
MARGFRLEEHHIVQALQPYAVTCSDALLDRVFGMLDIPAVERAALRGTDRVSQAAHACQEIGRQVHLANSIVPAFPSPLMKAA